MGEACRRRPRPTPWPGLTDARSLAEQFGAMIRTEGVTELDRQTEASLIVPLPEASPWTPRPCGPPSPNPG